MTDFDPWPFEQPPDTWAGTTREVSERREAVLTVHHRANGDGWDFLGRTAASEEQACLISLKQAVDFDASLLELADLPSGWLASRSSPKGRWERRAVKRSMRDDPWGLDPGVTPKTLPGAAIQSIGRILRWLIRMLFD